MDRIDVLLWCRNNEHPDNRVYPRTLYQVYNFYRHPRIREGIVHIVVHPEYPYIRHRENRETKDSHMNILFGILFVALSYHG